MTAGANSTATVTNTANWITYPIVTAIDPAAGGTITCEPNPVNHGQAATCAAIPNTGYTFGGFSGDCAGPSCALSNVTGLRSVTALFTLNSYAVLIAASPPGGGIVSCAPNPVAHGGDSTCTATPNTGYSFNGFSGDCAGAACALSNVTSAKNVTASFTLDSYSVTATTGPNGSISPASQTINHGNAATFSVMPDTGYIASVSGCGGTLSGNTYSTGPITQACTVTASFSKSDSYPITLTAVPPEGGSVSCTPNPVPQNGASTCAAVASSGYLFSGWSGDCAGTGACALDNVTSAKNVAAHFTRITASKTFTGPTSTGGNATVTFSGGGDNCDFSPDTRFVSVESAPVAPPATHRFLEGLLEFALDSCEPGSTAIFTVRYPAPLPENASYWKYGATPDQSSPHWYPLPQAHLAGDTATFTITDGGLGDGDLAANGRIVDPGGPTVLMAVEIPTLSDWILLALSSLLLGMGGWRLRRIGRPNAD